MLRKINKDKFFNRESVYKIANGNSKTEKHNQGTVIPKVKNSVRLRQNRRND